MTITEFLLARIAEDEKVALEAHKASMRGHAGPGFIRSIIEWGAQARGVRGAALIEVMTPARVLADVDAKRRIVERVKYEFELQTNGWHTAQKALYDLAAVYADHPDYQREWAL